MKEEQVRVEQLPPMRVATVHAFGPSPEMEAFARLRRWAERRGLYDFSQHRIFGFNNPPPSHGSPNYGYEYWMSIGPEVGPDGEVEVKDFPGGLYAVVRCEVRGDPWAAIPAAWQKLVAWQEQSAYKMGNQQSLEEHLSPSDTPNAEWDMDIYLSLEP